MTVAALRNIYQRHEDALNGSGLVADIQPYPDSHAAFLEEQGAFISPPFLLSYQGANFGANIAVRLVDGKHTIGYAGARLIECRDTEDLFTGRYFLNAQDMVKPPIEQTSVPLEDWPSISGKVVHQGGLYVAPEYRGGNIGWRLTRLTRLIRAAAMICLDADHAVGQIPTTTARPKEWYGYKRSCLSHQGFRWRDNTYDLRLMHISRAEFISDLEFAPDPNGASLDSAPLTY